MYILFGTYIISCGDIDVIFIVDNIKESGLTPEQTNIWKWLSCAYKQSLWSGNPNQSKQKWEEEGRRYRVSV